MNDPLDPEEVSVEEEFDMRVFPQPKIIFIPEQKVVRKMVKAILNFSNDPLDIFLLRFGLIDFN